MSLENDNMLFFFKKNLRNTSMYISWESRSGFFGLCHTFKFLKPVKENTFYVNLLFKRNHDIKIFVHELDAEFWLKQAIFPIPMEEIEIPIKSDPNLGIVRNLYK